MTGELSLSQAHTEVEDCEAEGHACIPSVEYEISSEEIVKDGASGYNMCHALVNLLNLIVPSTFHGLSMACCPVDGHNDEMGEDSE